jgi:hypothetical protein
MAKRMGHVARCIEYEFKAGHEGRPLSILTHSEPPFTLPPRDVSVAQCPVTWDPASHECFLCGGLQPNRATHTFQSQKLPKQ